MSTHAILTKGLQSGFAGGSTIEKTTRGSFDLTTSHLELEGEIYHDEWVSGGGQEFVKTKDGEAMTRVYVGNVIAAERLEKLGIEEKDVMSILKKVIIEHGEKIRFDSDFELTIDDWHYSYKVTFRSEDPFIINGIEEIYYQDKKVFIHTFGISKVVEG